MIKRFQSTSFRKSFGSSFQRLEQWSLNPWRRYSLLLIVLLAGFFIGSSIGMISGALALMDPIGAFITVGLLELLVRFRRPWISSNKLTTCLHIVDASRIGFLYGVFVEGFKLA